jgi:hypothetical protein
MARYFRNNLNSFGGKFAVAAFLDGKLVGVTSAGRPVARNLNDGKTVRVYKGRSV